MLDRYLLRYFLAVVEQGNFSRAAAHCHVSQPTLSVGIAKLEALLGIRLFVRSSQRVELTSGGNQLLVHARRIEREFNLALQSLGRAESVPSLRLGILSSIPGDIVAAAIVRARPEREHRFELLFGSERELVGHLAKDRIDAALTLVGRGADRFLEEPVCAEGFALALPQSHPLASIGDIAAEQLASEPMIVRRHCEALSDLSRFFTERGLRPHFSFRSTNDERVLQMVAAGLGVTVMPWSFQAPGVARPKLAGFDLRRSLGWAAAHAAEHLLASPPPIMVEIANEMSNKAKG